MINENIIVTIFNHENNDNANALLETFSKDFETCVLDSGSKNKDENFVLLDNIYYNGLFNYASNLLLNSTKKYLLLITSDVIISEKDYQNLK